MPSTTPARVSDERERVDRRGVSLHPDHVAEAMTPAYYEARACGDFMQGLLWRPRTIEEFFCAWYFEGNKARLAGQPRHTHERAYEAIVWLVDMGLVDIDADEVITVRESSRADARLFSDDFGRGPILLMTPADFAATYGDPS